MVDNNPDTPETPDTPAEETVKVEEPSQDVPKEEPVVEEPAPEADPEPEPTEEPDEPEEDTSDDEEQHDHPALRQVDSMLKEAKLSDEDTEAIFAGVSDTGDMSKLDMQALVDKLGKDKAEVVKMLTESYLNTEFKAMNEIKESSYAITEGEDNFNAMRDWAREKEAADPQFAKDLLEIRQMVDSRNPRAVKAAITELFDLYRADPETTIAAKLEVGDKTPGSAGLEPMSRMDYINAVEKAHKNGTYDQESKALWARRQSGIKNNI